MLYLFQRIIQNHFQWTRPSPGRLGPAGEGKYVKENGFGHEDWNFNKNLLIDESIYGYCYYRPTEEKRDEKFNIIFAEYINQQWYIIGFFLNCEFVHDPPININVIKQKMRDLRHLGNSLGNDWKKLNDKQFINKLKYEARWLNWKVSPDNAIRTLQPIPIPKSIFYTKNFRIVKPTEINKSIFDNLYSLSTQDIAEFDYGYDSEFPEGKEIELKHKARERNQSVVKRAKDLFKNKNGTLYCQVCGFDFYAKYGSIGRDFIEAHHTVPVSDLKGEVKTKVNDIALVCSNCHRMLHRKRPWLKMNDLEKLINKNA